MSAVSDFGQTPRSALWSGVANSPLMLAGLGAAALTAGLAVSVRDVAPALSNVLMMAGPLGVLTGAGGLWLGRRGTRGGPDGAPPGNKGEAPPESLVEAVQIMASAFACWDAEGRLAGLCPYVQPRRRADEARLAPR